MENMCKSETLRVQIINQILIRDIKKKKFRLISFSSNSFLFWYFSILGSSYQPVIPSGFLQNLDPKIYPSIHSSLEPAKYQ